MPEQQPGNSCEYCGYPKEIGEHALDCLNRLDEIEEVDALGPEQEKGIVVEAEHQDNEQFFVELGISKSDEATYREQNDNQETDPALVLADQRSFNNIRESLRMTLDYYSNQGVPDWKTYSKEEEVMRAELWRKAGYEPGKSIPWQVGREIDEKITDELGQPEIIRFDTKELKQQIKKEVEVVHENARITYNVSDASFEKIMQAGRIISKRELPADEQEKHIKTGGIIGEIGGSDSEGYDERRLRTEQVMGIAEHEEGSPIYAALHGGSEVDLDDGAAAQYGSYVFELDDKTVRNRTIFTEGDSMNPMGMIDAIRSKERMSERNGIQDRQLNRGHAEIALALYNISQRIGKQYNKDDQTHQDLSEMVKYIEAQVLRGVSLSDVKSITVNNWEFDSDLDLYKKEYPEFANKFRLGHMDGMQKT